VAGMVNVRVSFNYRLDESLDFELPRSGWPVGGRGGGEDTALLNYIDVGGSSPLWIDSNIPRQVVGMSKKAG
jgi:hypothetical protein